MKGWVAWPLAEYAAFCAEHGLGPALGESMRVAAGVAEAADGVGSGDVAGSAGAADVAGTPEPDNPHALREAVLLRHAASRTRLGIRIAGPGHRLLVDVGLLGGEAYFLSRAEALDVSGTWRASAHLWCLALPTTVVSRALPGLIEECGEDLGVSVLSNRPERPPWFLLRAGGTWHLPAAENRPARVEPGTVVGLFAGAVADAVAQGLPPATRAATVRGAA